MRKYFYLALCLIFVLFGTFQTQAQEIEMSTHAGLDSDGDGVVDSLDFCPWTQISVKVDKYGCPLDYDGDGLTDDIDRCPKEYGPMEYLGCPDYKYLEEETGIHNFPTLIKFKKDKSDLAESETSNLDTIVNFLMSNPTMSVSFLNPNLGARTKATSDFLTTVRFNYIISYFIEKGIDESKLKIRTHYRNTEEAASKFHLIFIPWRSSSQEDIFLIKLVRFADKSNM